MKKFLLLLFFIFSIVTQAQNYYINNFAGSGVNNYSGDGGPATSAAMGYPSCVAIGPSGNVYIADPVNGVIRKVTKAQKIYTVGYASSTTAMVTDAHENLILIDQYDNQLCLLDTLGNLSYIAGTGNQGHTGDGGPATAAQLNQPSGIVLDKQGNIYFSEIACIRKINSNGIITTIAGTGTTGYSGDGSAATAAQLNNPYGLALDTAGNLYVADYGNNCVRVINTAGIITTVAGTGTVGYTGNGGAATAAQLKQPEFIAFDKQGNMYISETGNCVIRMVNTSGIISTFAGNHTCSSIGDGLHATSASLDFPQGICLDTLNNLYVADNQGHRVRKVGYCASDISVNITGPTVTCGNSRTVLKATGATTYNWYSGNVYTGTSHSSTTDSLVIFPEATTTMTVYGLSGSCAASATFTVQVTPSVTITATKSIICKGDTTTITAAGASTYTWTIGQYGSTIKVSPPSTNIYYLYASAGGCTVEQTVTITVNPTPTVTINNPTYSALHCPNMPVTLSSGGASTYTWSANAGNVNTYSASVNPSITTTYSVVGTNTLGCSSKATTTINIVKASVTVSPSKTVCPGSYPTLYATGPNQNCTWSANVNSTMTSTAVTVVPQDTATYTATFDYYDNYSNQSCYVSDSITLFVPYVKILAPSSANICRGDTLTISPYSSSNTYTLTPGNISTATISLTPTVTTTYTITGSNAYCSQAQTMQVFVHACTIDTVNGVVSNCQNYDLESGKFAGWFAQHSSGAQDATTNYGVLDLTGVDSSGFNRLNHAHEACNTGNDSLVTVLPRVNSPYSQSVRLGKDLANFNHQTLSTTFKVSVADTDFVFSYAFVSDGQGLASAALASPSVHAEPFFQAKFFDDINQEITGTRFFYGASTSQPTGYFTAYTPYIGYESLMYQTWTPVHTNLRQYLGQTVTVFFETCDCNEGAHFGYAYIELGCPGSVPTTGLVNNQNSTLHIYPNPAQNKITIDANDVVDVKLFDVLGKQITSTKENQVDVSNLSNGVYFVQVKTSTTTTTQKITVQH